MSKTNFSEIESFIANLTIEEIMDLINFRPDESIKPERLIRNIIISSLYSLIVIISFFGNLLVLTVCLQNLTKTNALILSLSSSDLLMTVFNIPFNVVRLLKEDWPFGQLLCSSVPFVQVMVVYVSSFTMAVIAFHRWRSVSLLTTSSTSYLSIKITILITWCLSALMAIPTSIFNEIVTMYTFKKFIRCRVVYPESEFNIPLMISIEVFLTQYFIPLSLSIYLYIKIGKVISRQGKIINLRGNCEAKRRQRDKRRRIVMLVLVVAVFAICWFPLNVYHILVDSRIVTYNYKVFITCHWFAVSSVCYNPFIYCWLNKTFRNGAKKALSCFRCGFSPIEGSNTINGTSIRGCFTDTLPIETNRTTIELQGIRENNHENNNHVFSL